jgi:hypothetical protein
MALIASLVAGLRDVFSKIGTAFTRGTKSTIENTFSARAAREQNLVRDIVDSISHVSPESIADKLHQTAFTTARMIQTEASTIAWPKNLLPNRNLVVSGRLKSARKYRVFYQADMTLGGDLTGERRHFSIYTNNLKTFNEYEADIADTFNTELYGEKVGLANVSFHHILHQRGAPR